MPTLFVDTGYYIAMTDRRDRFHRVATELTRLQMGVPGTRLVTSEIVLVETLNHMSRGRESRRTAAELVRNVPRDPRMTVVRMSRDLYEAALALYESRLDKTYGMVDCISMVVCRERNIEHVLAGDHHFVQEGFRALLLEGDA